MQEILNSITEQINNHQVNLERLVLLQIVIGVCLLLYYILGKRLLQYLFRKGTIVEAEKKKLRNIVRFCFFLLALLFGIMIVGLNIGIPKANSPLNIANVLLSLLIIQIARLFDYFFGKAVCTYYDSIKQADDKSLKDYTNAKPRLVASKTIQYAIYTFAIMVILQNFEIDHEIFSFNVGGDSTYSFRISNIFSTIFILLLARLLVWFIVQIFLSSYYRSRAVDFGSQYAMNQLVSYFIYVIAIVLVLDNLGVEMTVLWGGLAALLVGVGLGLQQTFNDLFSGILLLFERTVEVGDVVEIGEKTGSVKKIGLRTSLIETRDQVTLIIPNSKLVMDGITNWTHFDAKVRFKINVGVAYGSDTQLVKKLLLQVANAPNILEWPAPFVRFTNFGDSSLDFELLFYSTDFVNIKDIKSDLRFEIDRLFRENDIQIPFPQRDIWIRNEK